MRKWTQADLAFLRQQIGTLPFREIAKRLGRTYSSVLSTAQRHGVVSRQFWTEAEETIVRERTAAGDTVAQLARLLPGRSISSLQCARQRLGLTRQLKLGEAFREFIREKHAAQWTDSEIADEWNRLHPDRRTGLICRECVSRRRRRMGLATNQFMQRRRQRAAAKTREQLTKGGAGSLAELHRRVIQDRITAMGWPADLRYREAQILTILWDRGPLMKREIAAAAGMRVREMSRKMLKSSGPGGNYLADLMQRGLVISFPRVVALGGKGHNVTLYSLSPDIQRRKVADHEQHARNHRKRTTQKPHGSNQPDAPHAGGDLRSVHEAAPLAAGAA